MVENRITYNHAAMNRRDVARIDGSQAAKNRRGVALKGGSQAANARAGTALRGGSQAAKSRGGNAFKGDRWYDYTLFFIVLLLSAFGLVMIFSSSYAASKNGGTHFVARQLIWTVCGIAVMLLVSLVDYHIWMMFALPAYIVSIALLPIIYFTDFGKEVNGKKRWFAIGGRSLFQPSEVLKVALILFMAYACSKYIREIDEAIMTFCLLMLAAIPSLLVAYSNLSTGIIIAGIGFTVCFVASRKKLRYAVMLGGVFLTAAIVVLFIKHIDISETSNYIVSRIKVWLDTESYALGGGYQTLQGLYAVGSGGVTGKGLGNSLQKIGNIPEAHNDMIFAIICEELGLIGGLFLILMLGYLIYRLLVIAMNAPDLKGLLLMSGIIAHVGIQSVLHIAVVLNVIPNTGVSLPFISYGGTSTLMLMAEMGLALSVSHSVILREGSKERERRLALAVYKK